MLRSNRKQEQVPPMPCEELEVLQGYARNTEYTIGIEAGKAVASPPELWDRDTLISEKNLAFFNWLHGLKEEAENAPPVYDRSTRYGGPNLMMYRRCSRAGWLGLRYESTGPGWRSDPDSRSYFTYMLPHTHTMRKSPTIMKDTKLVDIEPLSSPGDDLELGDKVLPSHLLYGLSRSRPFEYANDCKEQYTGEEQYFFITQIISSRDKDYRIYSLQSQENYHENYSYCLEEDLIKIPRVVVPFEDDFLVRMIGDVENTYLRPWVSRFFEWSCMAERHDQISREQRIRIQDLVEVLGC